MNIGEYVRTKDYGIHKISNLEHYDYIDYIVCENQFNIIKIDKSNIIKSSPNIIDLIEVGDYVNGCLIVEINKDPFIKGQINLWTNMIVSMGEPFPNEYYKKKILAKDIKSIVTKEQFEAMKYEIK